jgi:hypothetical protein
MTSYSKQAVSIVAVTDFQFQAIFRWSDNKVCQVCQTTHPVSLHFGGPLFGIFWYLFDHLEYFEAICYCLILWLFGICCCHLLYCPHFGIHIVSGKIWQP